MFGKKQEVKISAMGRRAELKRERAGVSKEYHRDEPLDNHARILYSRKDMNAVVPLTEARNRFAELVEEASQLFARFTITRRGKPEAVLMGKEEYDALIDTLEVLANKETMASLRRAKEDIKKGRVRPLEDVVRELNINV